MDEEIIKRIKSQTDSESLRQSLYELLNLSDKAVALSTAIEYTYYDNWMIRRNAIMILGQLQDSRATPRLLEIIQNEVNRKKNWVQIGDKGDDYAQEVDTHILKACVNSIIQCGDPEHILALSAYTDRLTYEHLFGEDTISTIKEALNHVPKGQLQTTPATSVDVDRLQKSIEEERRSWEAWLREEKERLAKEQRDLWERERQLAEKERKLTEIAKEIPDGYAIGDDEQLPVPVPSNVPGVNQVVVVAGIVILAVIVVLLILVISSQTPSVTPTQTPKLTPTQNAIVTQIPTIQYCDVGGQVLTKTGHGIAGATVVMGRQSIVTDKNGYYKISGVPIGNCWVIVWNPAATGMIFEKTLLITGSTNSLNLVEGTFGN